MENELAGMLLATGLIIFILSTAYVIYLYETKPCESIVEIKEVIKGCPISCPTTKVCTDDMVMEKCIEIANNAETLKGVFK